MRMITKILLRPMAGAVLLLSLLSCKNKQIKGLAPLTPLLEKTLGDHEVKELSFEGFGLQGELIAGESLKVKNVEASNKADGPYHSLLIHVDGDERADYFEFYICSQANPNECSPTLGSPGRFAAQEHLYPLAPEGTVGVYVRACVKAEQALINGRNCGDWGPTALASQQRNGDTRLKEQVALRYREAQGLVDDCADMRRDMQDYRREAGANADPQLVKLVDNHLQGIAPETCKEMLINDNFVGLANEMTLVTSLQGQQADKGSATLLALGSTAIAAGFVASGVGAWKLRSLSPVQRAATTVERSQGGASVNRWKALTGLGVLTTIAGAVLIGIDQGLRLEASPADRALAKLRMSLNDCYRSIEGRLATIKQVTKIIDEEAAAKL